MKVEDYSKTLVISPNLNGFSKFITNGLKGYGPNVVGFFRYNNFLIKNILRLFSIYEISMPKRIVWGKWQKMTGFTTVVLFADVASDDVVKILEKNNPYARKICFIWSIGGSIPNSVKSDSSWELWSFDKRECDSLGYRFVNQFYPKYTIADSKPVYDFCFCGYSKNRKELIEKLANIFSSYGFLYKIVVREWGVKNWINSIRQGAKGIIVTPFETDYLDYLKLIMQSKCVLDIVQTGQIGLTMRVMEALFFKKKLLTNNLDIISYPFYCPENIFVLGLDDMKNIKNWLNIPMNHSYSIKDHTVESWYKKMGIETMPFVLQYKISF